MAGREECLFAEAVVTKHTEGLTGLNSRSLFSYNSSRPRPNTKVKVFGTIGFD